MEKEKKNGVVVKDDHNEFELMLRFFGNEILAIKLAASNFNGKKSVTIDSSISYFVKCNTGDILTAKTKEINSSKKFAIYEVEILNQENKLIAKFKGTVYRFIENIKS